MYNVVLPQIHKEGVLNIASVVVGCCSLVVCVINHTVLGHNLIALVQNHLEVGHIQAAFVEKYLEVVAELELRMLCFVAAWSLMELVLLQP